MPASSLLIGMSGRIVPMLLVFGALLAPMQGATDRLDPIREGRKSGFINRAGGIVVAPQYDAVGEEREGRIRITTGICPATSTSPAKSSLLPSTTAPVSFVSPALSSARARNTL